MDFATLSFFAKDNGRMITSMSGCELEVMMDAEEDGVVRLRGPDGAEFVVAEEREAVDFDLQLAVHPI